MWLCVPFRGEKKWDILQIFRVFFPFIALASFLSDVSLLTSDVRKWSEALISAAASRSRIRTVEWHMIILYINHGFTKWRRFILFTLLHTDSPLCVLLSFEDSQSLQSLWSFSAIISPH